MERLYRLIVVAVLALVALACGTKSAPAVIAGRPVFLDSVRPMQIKYVEEGMGQTAHSVLKGWGLLGELQTGDLTNMCSISMINDQSDYMLTAAHCVQDIGAEGRFVEGQPLEVVEADYITDIAVVQVPGLSMKALKVVFEPVEWMQEVIIAGHPLGYSDVFITRGWVANPETKHFTPANFMLFNVPAAPGNSGSAVLNLKGEIVSVLQIGWARTFSPVSGGATVANMERLVKRYLPKPVPTVIDSSNGILVINPIDTGGLR